MLRDRLTSCTKLFCVFFRIGISSVGGGYVMIPLMRREISERRSWLSAEELTDCFALSQTTPGVIAVNTATYTGYRLAGIPGALAATLGMVLPSLGIIMGVALFFRDMQEHPVVRSAFAGIRIAVAVLLLCAVQSIARMAVRDRFGWAVAVVAFAGVLLAGASPILLVPAAGLSGCLVRRIRRRVGAEC